MHALECPSCGTPVVPGLSCCIAARPKPKVNPNLVHSSRVAHVAVNGRTMPVNLRTSAAHVAMHQPTPYAPQPMRGPNGPRHALTGAPMPRPQGFSHS